ncbi:hypothetical protein [Xanthomonas hortorum]|uniref:hypothetical protein n=1 Tax=Xanthomonas hortorum TaxID=56454 RepID=UPI0015D5A346|nr:hypothetical protein [Xanthomonas hortorum]MCE4352606.1 hypothetical protein [Xanthomonas hortorum pv. pelargonii]MCM5526661.1 hypothetical protein [Xanthomonas hortorum pv. pelargonii]MCM5537975.1 hypothetical protein [Xanthomonas hortorum pv. pelargonii]MCM5542138.1 hypothetical protein [Xanthomonas hortorum pv. pelargonii]MCM5545690.1 hypothetical protein [Xanthomonas hortorum pv. pelargonii]
MLLTVGHRAARDRSRLRGCGLGNSGHADEYQHHRRRQPTARLQMHSTEGWVYQIADTSRRSAMSTLLTTGIQLNSLH